MVYVFFCIDGVLSDLPEHRPLTRRDGIIDSSGRPDADLLALMTAVEDIPGVVVVVGNDWPCAYEIHTIRTTCAALGRRIVNGLMDSSAAQEQSVLSFMSTRPEPYLVVAPPDFGFCEIPPSRRIDFHEGIGFDSEAQSALISRLREIGYLAVRRVTRAQELGAMPGGQPLERARQNASALHAKQDEKFQLALQSLLGEGP
ncbi:hypothetical protein [Pararobbsia alpina]|uniref:hypothetical protein n=1 Tax=Pararobbsia alpina TaxID=621374 RepID=UPI0039A4314D